MGLPSQLQEDFVAEFKREPVIVARATCDITGEDGLTWLACDGTMLVCYSRPAGGEFSRLDYRIAEATALEIVEKDSHLQLQARFPEAEFVLRLPLGEAQALAKLAALQPPSDSVNIVAAPAALTPNLVCGAAAYALVQADGEHDKTELDWVVARFGNLNSFRRGGAWVAKHGFAELLPEANRLLTLVQKESLLFNLVELGFADSSLSRAERTMLDEWRQAFGVGEERFDRIFDAMLARASINVLVNEASAGPDWMPMNLLCACLLAVIRHHPESSERRTKSLERRIQSTDAINAGQTYLDQLDPDGLVTMLPHMLNPVQRRCVVLNVLSEAYFDGVPEAEVTAFLGQLREGLEIPAAEFDADVEIFRTLGERTLFREAASARR
ncbi:MAG: hypothetical protein ABMA26_19910 [Limisphaerales bacterium]